MWGIFKRTAVCRICCGLFKSEKEAQQCYNTYCCVGTDYEFLLVYVDSLESLSDYILFGVECHRVIFEVFDGGKKAEMHGWVHPVCTDFESAVIYAKKWLGEYESLCPDKPNQIIDYCGYGSTIEIREINKE